MSPIHLTSSETELLNKTLTDALLRNDTEKFRTILKKEGWPCYSYWSDFDLLMQAIKHDRKEIVHFLLDSGCRVYKKPHIVTPLHLAASKEGWTDVVERLIKMDLQVADKSNYGRANGDTALHSAFSDRFSDLDRTIDLLLSSHLQQWGEKKFGNIANKDQLSFLHIACTRPNLNVVKKLFEADENAIYSQETKLFRTPLHFAVEYGRHQIAEYLLKCGSALYKQDNNKSTPLHLALKRRDDRMIDLLFTYDKRWKNAVNLFGLSHFMASCAGSNVDIVKKYIENTKSLSKLITTQVKTLGYSYELTGYTALHFAADFGRIEIVKLLLENGANCCTTNANGFTAHHLAQKQGFTNVCTMLQEHCDRVKKCKKMRSESPDFKKWGDDYEKDVLNQRMRMFEYLDETLKNLKSLSKSAQT